MGAVNKLKQSLHDSKASEAAAARKEKMNTVKCEKQWIKLLVRYF